MLVVPLGRVDPQLETFLVLAWFGRFLEGQWSHSAEWTTGAACSWIWPGPRRLLGTVVPLDGVDHWRSAFLDFGLVLAFSGLSTEWTTGRNFLVFALFPAFSQG